MNFKLIGAATIGLGLVACTSTTNNTSLDSSRWYMSGEHYQIADIALPAFTLEKNNSGYKVTGTTGCNRFFGQASLDNDVLIFQDGLASSRKSCGETANAIESDFLQAAKYGFELKNAEFHLSSGAIMKQVPKS
ncbi:META domain-containing protein [Alginatibacterium sediminis]|uniref:META domain-containing protein n=1 Tax=Alginatibacterium sediminis TaxID=2164068 RepID=A0A420E8Z1_9ALTE|nr:META domain-containing protein [Alginatibacterium sediminis]RKF15926.1 META domain-containing protein [Alginatibacterium sediminis]